MLENQRDIDRLESGVDYLTLTAVTGEQSLSLHEQVDEWINSNLPPDTIPKQWAFRGYRGLNYGPIRVGVRSGDEMLVMTSGNISDRLYLHVRVDPKQVKRLDLQVTVALTQSDPDVARKIYHEYRRTNDEKANSKKATYMSSSSGDTVSFGQRGREVYLRLYDKSGESGIEEIGAIWRYEVEYKRGVAERVYREMVKSRDRYGYIAGKVWAEFERRGVSPMFHPETEQVAMETVYEVTTPETKLKWLERCVAPVVTQLVNLGYENEVVNNLKLRGIYRK